MTQEAITASRPKIAGSHVFRLRRTGLPCYTATDRTPKGEVPYTMKTHTALIPALLVFCAVSVTVSVLVGCISTEPSSNMENPPALSEEVMQEATEDAVQETPAEAPREVHEVPHETQAQGSQKEQPPPVVPVSSDGYALSDLIGQSHGLRLEYTVVRGGIPEQPVSVVVQPSSGAWANRSVHGDGSVAYAVMGESESGWYCFRGTAMSDRSAVLSIIPWPRFFPRTGQVFQYSEENLTARIRPDDGADENAAPSRWSVAYRIDKDYGRGLYGEALFRFAPSVVEPSASPQILPRVIRYVDTTGTELRFDLVDATVYRAREITGAVVNRFGQPQSGYVVAPHPMIGLLPPEHLGVTDETGRFSIAYRAAPGDVIKLYFGPIAGEGRSSYISQPLEIQGRVESPDFASLIYTIP